MESECEVAGADTAMSFSRSIVLDRYVLRISARRALKESPVMVGLI
jgi:hypothetical protein